MPAEMSVECCIAWIAGKPGGEEVAAAICIAALVADVRDTMRAMRILLVEKHGSLDLRPRLRDTAILAERDRVIGQEPVVIAIMRGETIEQLRVLPLVSNAAGAANETVRIRCRRYHQCIARPLSQMGMQSVNRGVGLARVRKVEEPDMSRLSCGRASGDIFGRCQGRSCRSRLAFTHQDLGLAHVRNGESRIGGERAVEGLDRTGIHGERQIEALYIGVARGGGGSGHGEVIAVCEHRKHYMS